MKKIHVKYCGGCNPEYDRVLAVSVLAGLKNVTISTDWCPEADGRLAINGCRRKCASKNARGGYHDICSPGDMEKWLLELSDEE